MTSLFGITGNFKEIQAPKACFELAMRGPHSDRGTLEWAVTKTKIHGFLAILAVGLACASGHGAPGKITAEQLRQRIESDEPPTILDVRTAREFASGHLPGAIHLPFLEVKKRIDEIPVDDEQDLIVYCGHGPRAYWARRSLRKQGLGRVVLLEGHFQHWARKGFPVEP